MALSDLTRDFRFAGNNDLAIDPRWIPQILDAAELLRTGGPQAVEAQRGEPLEYAYNVSIRDGVAIIPITGPIFRYHSWLYYFFGGTSVGLLARDFNAALNDPRVHSIIFEVNSPGGEVTGINELARMIFAARGRKPMTARVGGMCCSAAYWIASACGDIVIDETAQLGSIGVYASFIDTKKFDAKYGFREFKIISDDSPDKCPDPASPAGEKLIKARLNALCDVFIASVAEFRDVTPEKVRADFGKGDVRVGEHAIEAGLADGFGSLEETIAALAEAHGPAKGTGFTGALYAQDVIAGGSPDLIFRAAEEEEESVDEDEPETCPDHPDGCPDGEPCQKAAGTEIDVSAHAPVTTQPKEGTPEMATATEEKPSGATNASQPTIEQLLAQVQTLSSRLETSETARAESDKRVESLETSARTNRLSTLAKDFAGDINAKVGFMEKLAAAFGEGSDELKAYVTEQNAHAEQLRASGLFKENGSSNSSTAATATDQLMGKVKALRDTNPQLSEAEAQQRVFAENPGLYEAYMGENTRRV